MSTYIPLFPHLDLSSSLECLELKVTRGGLEIALEWAGEKTVVIRFEHYLAFRMMDEGDALLALTDWHEHRCSQARVFRVGQSEFLQWFHEQNLGLRSNDGLHHFAIYASNDVIDVIAFEAPRLAD